MILLQNQPGIPYGITTKISTELLLQFVAAVTIGANQCDNQLLGQKDHIGHFSMYQKDGTLLKTGNNSMKLHYLTVILMTLVRGCLFLLFTSEVVGSLLGYPKPPRGLRGEGQLMAGGRVLPKPPCGFFS